MKTDREQQRENRLWNTRQLIRTCGGVNAAARILKRDNSYVTAIAGPNPTRSIGDKTANTIEAARNDCFAWIKRKIIFAFCCLLFVEQSATMS